jgi:hypothetical protein
MRLPRVPGRLVTSRRHQTSGVLHKACKYQVRRVEAAQAPHSMTRWSRHLAQTRGSNDPLGSFVGTVITGEASLRVAANFPWHSEALTKAAETGASSRICLPSSAPSMRR